MAVDGVHCTELSYVFHGAEGHGRPHITGRTNDIKFKLNLRWQEKRLVGEWLKPGN